MQRSVLRGNDDAHEAIIRQNDIGTQNPIANKDNSQNSELRVASACRWERISMCYRGSAVVAVVAVTAKIQIKHPNACKESRLVCTLSGSLSGSTPHPNIGSSAVSLGFLHQQTSPQSTNCRTWLVRHLRKSTMRMPLRGSNSDAICENEELMFTFVITRADHHKHKWIVILARAELNPVLNGWRARSVVHV